MDLENIDFDIFKSIDPNDEHIKTNSIKEFPMMPLLRPAGNRPGNQALGSKTSVSHANEEFTVKEDETEQVSTLIDEFPSSRA